MSTTRILRHMNTRQCLRVLRDKGLLSRADIARELETTRATVGNAVRELISSGLVIPTDQQADVAQVGRPGTALSLNPDGAYFVGVEVNKEGLTAQLFDFSMTALATQHSLLRSEFARLKPVVMEIVGAIRALVRCARISEKKVYGAGISVPGIVSSAGRVLIPSAPEWQAIDLKFLVSEHLPRGWVVKVCNNAAAVAAWLCESLDEAEKRDFLFILLSLGVGSAMVKNGQVDKGAHGFAGEIGHLIMNPRLSARRDTFEQLAGYQRFLPFMDRRKTPADALLALAKRPPGSAAFKRLLRDWSDVLSAGLLNAIHMMDPAHIMLGGPMTVLYPHVEQDVVSALRQNLLPGLDVPPIRLAEATPEAAPAASGAAAYVRQDLFQLPTLRSPGGFY